MWQVWQSGKCLMWINIFKIPGVFTDNAIWRWRNHPNRWRHSFRTKVALPLANQLACSNGVLRSPSYNVSPKDCLGSATPLRFPCKWDMERECQKPLTHHLHYWWPHTKQSSPFINKSSFGDRCPASRNVFSLVFYQRKQMRYIQQMIGWIPYPHVSRYALTH